MKMSKLLKKITHTTLATLMVTALALTGCQGKAQTSEKTAENKPQASSKEEKKDTTDEKVEIRIMTRWSGTDGAAPFQKEVIEEFMKRNPNIIVVDESINEEAAYMNKLKADVATGSAPHIFQANTFQEYAKNGLLLDLTEVIQADKEWSDGFIGGVFEDGTDPSVPGKYFLPVGVNYEVFYYNTDLFEKAGIQQEPKTYGELLEVIKKLRDANIVPIGAGAKDTWRIGHLHNPLLYKTAGVQKAKDLAARTAKWTDADVVKSIQMLKDLKDMGAFEANLEGLDYNSEKANFFAGKTAMVFNGSWLISEIAGTPVDGKIKTFLFPVVEGYEQFEGDNIIFQDSLVLNGKVEGAEKEAMIAFAKFLTSKEMQEKFVYDVKRASSRADVEIDGAQLDPLFVEVIGYASQIKVPGKDAFAYDSLASMQDRTRNSLVGVLLGNSPEEGAKEIQDEIDRNTK